MLKNARTVGVCVVSLALVYLASGCATLQGGPSDEELLGKLLETYSKAMKEGDADALIALYSKDYESPRGGDYEETTERLREVIPRLAEYDVNISTDDAKAEVDGNQGSVGPINFDADRGAWSTTLITTKEEDGCWRITGTEYQRGG
jgi:hypothetical protein